MLIFTAQMVLTPAMMATHQRHAFRVPTGVKSLLLDFFYSPKYETDMEKLRVEAVPLLMKAYGECPLAEDTQAAMQEAIGAMQRASNLITLSLDGPGGFVGASHRQEDPIHIEVGAHGATPGYTPGRIAEGIWTVWLHTHAICSAYVSCSLHVRAEMERDV